MDNPTATYLLLQERLGEPLPDYIERARRNRRSWNAIARDLHTRTTVSVTSETLRTWFYALDRQLRATA